MTRGAVRLIDLPARTLGLGQILGRIFVAKDGNHPREVVGADVKAALRIHTASAPFRSAIYPVKQIRLLANILLDPLDKELERRGHRFARYADDFLILKKSARAAGRVMQSVIRFVEGQLGLVVNRQKSQAAPLCRCTFLGFALKRGQVVWTDKAYRRFKERIKEITSRSWGVSMSRRLEELRRYAVGWLHPVGYALCEGSERCG